MSGPSATEHQVVPGAQVTIREVNRNTTTTLVTDASGVWLVDGIDNNEFTFNTFIVMPSVEQVREFKVLTGVFSAEFGRGAGVVSVSTKSRANQLRGTGYEFLRNAPVPRHRIGRRRGTKTFSEQLTQAGIKNVTTNRPVRRTSG